MKTYSVLFRGINVGGKNVLPMKVLIALLERFGFQNVKTYIQSGNAVFRSKEEDASGLSNRISAAIERATVLHLGYFSWDWMSWRMLLPLIRFRKLKPSSKPCM
jgi:uncharacterized protein (DUF1697 family)